MEIGGWLWEIVGWWDFLGGLVRIGVIYVEVIPAPGGGGEMYGGDVRFEGSFFSVYLKGWNGWVGRGAIDGVRVVLVGLVVFVGGVSGWMGGGKGGMR
ncbi:hypothetical protein L873DRAFT_1174657 [Choiromyces venosus 120613-1]|uniref:Transmembrane protein n=1 Tax=Choiromyces venosus 120613-1 TaxID=1336337 RepID=A0A3N4K6K4_9PEZI|nr:hypothetical protein L873DRAFT_1174657 [Choiromyces venosus 120613-1]